MPGMVEWEADAESYVSAERAIFRRRLWTRAFWMRLAIIVVIVGTAVTLLIGLLDGDWDDALYVGLGSAGGGVIGGFLVLAMAYLLLPRRTRRLYAQQRTARGMRTMAWDDESANWSSPHGSHRVPWADYHGWAESRGEFLFYLNEQVPQILPKFALDGAQADDLRATLVAHGPPRR